MLWPILIVVGSNTIYNICTKSTPQSVNAFASLTFTYLVAAICSAGLFFATAEEKNLLAELTKTNLSSVALGVCIVGLEFGYICIYRAGWKINTASVVANISLACVLILVGFLLYKESVTPRQLMGLAVCAAGLVLVAK